MYSDKKIWIAKSDENVYLYPNMANRHGLITGASGTGKTVTLRVLAESFSDAGVPVFFADVKGDVGGLALPGEDNAKMQERISRFKIDDFEYKGYPVTFWDIFGENGHPVRTTVSDMGPQLLSRLMDLSDVQADVLNMVFRIADDKKLMLLDMKDLIAMLQYVNDNRKDLEPEYGMMSVQSIGAVQRSIRSLDDQGGDVFFGEPAMDISDWMKTDKDGRGMINILHSVKLVQNPKLYATFMLWLLSELFERLPEAGDVDKPKLVFFFDEAHMLFTDAPKALVQKIEQVVKLIRSKAVGVYFVTQSPSDIPDTVLAQLSNRVQHALRAYTPAEQKAVRAAATAFRQNPKFKTEDVITELGVGEALVSCLDEGGRPSIVQRAFILPPESLLKALDPKQYDKIILSNPMEKKYRDPCDRESAYEILTKERSATKEEEKKAQPKAAPKKEPAKRSSSQSTAKKQAGKAADKIVSTAASTIGRSVGKSIVRGLFGNLK